MALPAPGRCLARGGAWPTRRDLQAGGFGQVAVLHAAGGGRGDERPGEGPGFKSTIPVPDQGTGAGPGRRAAGTQPRGPAGRPGPAPVPRSEEHTSELQSLMRISYAVFCLKKKKKTNMISERIDYTMNERTT